MLSWWIILRKTGAYYAEELRRLRQEIVKKRRNLTRGVLHLQDNAPANISQVAMAVATKCDFEVLPHPPYFPDVYPSDFYLFPNLKTNLRGRNFGSSEGVIDAVDEYLDGQEEVFYFEEISTLEQR